MRSFEWGSEVESHPELKVTNAGDAEIRQAFFYYDVYDGRGTRLTTLMSEAKAIKPGKTARTHARFRPSGDEARCELVRIITMP